MGQSNINTNTNFPTSPGTNPGMPPINNITYYKSDVTSSSITKYDITKPQDVFITFSWNITDSSYVDYNYNLPTPIGSVELFIYEIKDINNPTKNYGNGGAYPDSNLVAFVFLHSSDYAIQNGGSITFNSKLKITNVNGANINGGFIFNTGYPKTSLSDNTYYWIYVNSPYPYDFTAQVPSGTITPNQNYSTTTKLAWFKTPYLTQAPSYDPIVYGGSIMSSPHIPADITVGNGSIVTLNGEFFYDKLSLDSNNNPLVISDLPDSAGFDYTDSNNIYGPWKTQVVLTGLSTRPINDFYDFVGTTTKRISFSHTFTTPFPDNSKRFYKSWVIKKDGTKVWGMTILGGKLSTRDKNYIDPLFPNKIITGTLVVNEYENPDPGLYGKWYQLYNDWQINIDNNRLSPYFSLQTNSIKTLQHPLHYYLNYVYKKDYNYQFRLVVENYSKDSGLRLITPWGETFSNVIDTTSITNNRINLLYYGNINSFTSGENKPKLLLSSKTNPQNPITISATSTPGNMGIPFLGVVEMDWLIQGHATYNIMTQTTNGGVNQVGTQIIPFFQNGVPIAGRGWHYIEDERKLVWFDKVDGPSGNYIYELNSNFPVGGNVDDYLSNKEPNVKYINNNFIAMFVPYQTFNINFDYVNKANFAITMYQGGQLPATQSSSYQTNIQELLDNGKVIKVGSLTQSIGTTQSCEFVGLTGNQYVFFVADPVIKFDDSLFNNGLFKQPTNGFTFSNGNRGYGTYSVISLNNFKISAAYSKGTNQIYTTDTSTWKAQSLTASYSMKVGKGNNVLPDSVNSIITTNSKAGNGSFDSGIWENGVWNSGWREDTTMITFFDIEQFYSFNKDKVWRIRITCNYTSTLTIGDKVSISNIVAIDINENRKLLKNYYLVTDVSKDNYIEVEVQNEFPVRRFEKDSDEHRIYVSKNIWLSGVFLNGYFKGIWNNGLFSGYPMLTKMEDSHWIDGTFNGGHFTSSKYTVSADGMFLRSIDNEPRLGLSFSTNHMLAKNDIISITYPDLNSNSTKYIGTTIVLDVPTSNSVITGVVWDNSYLNITNIKIYTIISTGLIQNFDFRSNNVSSVSSLDSMMSERVFSYNSWIDVNYSNQSAVNIGKQPNLVDSITKRPYSNNNLYGYPTNDILSSTSVFRDSFSMTSRAYKLGKKYRIFSDYVGDVSTFEDYFDPTDTQSGKEVFNSLGWDFGATSSLTFSRTPEPLSQNSPTVGKELRVDATENGGKLDLLPTFDISNRSNGTENNVIEKSRYTMVEFDILDFTSATSSDITTYNNGKYEQPALHFNNLNYVTRKEGDLLATYLPIYKNINHLNTIGTKKQEFFYNKRNLLMNFTGVGYGGKYQSTFYIDNLKFYEIDMVPFFQYFRNPTDASPGNINLSVQIPNSTTNLGPAPVIEYTDDTIVSPTSDNNEILTYYGDKLLTSNIQIPSGINWERDYSVYRTQDNDQSSPSGLY